MKIPVVNRGRLGVALCVGVLAVIGVAASVIGAGLAQASDPLVDPAAEETPIDPIAQALGADTPTEVVDLQDAQKELTAIAGSGSPEAEHINEVRSDLGTAVDDLYEDVADDPRAAHARDWWRQCMAARGMPFDSPVAIEDAILAPRDEAGRIDGHALETILTNRDECEAEASALLNDLVEDQLPEWVEENQEPIGEYQDLIESVSD